MSTAMVKWCYNSQKIVVNVTDSIGVLHFKWPKYSVYNKMQ
jgi:hypothetical protein